MLIDANTANFRETTFFVVNISLRFQNQQVLCSSGSFERWRGKIAIHELKLK